ncbi:hypothetical protein G7Z17_g2026 [Cylindrodendrum hubeiense]|uniref:Uncharacterized protein n=1 Tax=Cylindrodendrum hubeiense TaxID=595255 RepID=A0A9P5HIK5_9HYPO|nr:hypothetical protein G7Z17_g2026 [Cylindrodendrum hubeiense]
MASHKKFLQEITEANETVTTEIDELVTKINNGLDENAPDTTKFILLKLHSSLIRICEHRGHPRTSNKAILDAYYSFFGPIKTLSKLPSGDFLTARMLVYLTEAISTECALQKVYIKSKARVTTVPLYEFCTTLDDALLERLRIIWTASDKREDFCWIFGNYSLICHSSDEFSNVEEEKGRRSELAQTLTPGELAALGGIMKRSYLFTERGKKEDWRPLPDDPQDRSMGVLNQDKLMFKQAETDGPIRDGIEFHTVDDNQNDEKVWRRIDILRRSRQFILDSRHINVPILTEKSYRLAKRALSE